MTVLSLMHGWMILLGSLTTITLVMVAFGLMLGIVKPADAAKRVGTILGVVILLIVIPGVFVSAWSGLSLWQQTALVAIGIAVWIWLRPQRQEQRKKR